MLQAYRKSGNGRTLYTCGKNTSLSYEIVPLFATARVLIPWYSSATLQEAGEHLCHWADSVHRSGLNGSKALLSMFRDWRWGILNYKAIAMMRIWGGKYFSIASLKLYCL